MPVPADTRRSAPTTPLTCASTRRARWGGGGSNTIQIRSVTHYRYRGATVVSSLEEAVLTSLVIKDIRPGTRRQYLISLRPFFELNLDELTVSDLNSVLLTMTNQNTRRKCVIALKACVDHPAVKALRVPASVPRDYDLPSEGTLRLALLTCPHET